MKIRPFSLSLLFVALLCLAAPAFAQGDRGTITGQITDATGAVVPNVQVTAVQLTTHTTFKAVTTSVGVYRIPYLPPGTYEVSAALKGFKTEVVHSVAVAVATVVTADMKLELGATTESVTVSAAATQLESSSSELGYNVSADDYHDWPINSDDDGQRQITNFIFNSLPGTVVPVRAEVMAASTGRQPARTRCTSKVSRSGAPTSPALPASSSPAWTQSANSASRPAA